MARGLTTAVKNALADTPTFCNLVYLGFSTPVRQTPLANPMPSFVVINMRGSFNFNRVSVSKASLPINSPAGVITDTISF